MNYTAGSIHVEGGSHVVIGDGTRFRSITEAQLMLTIGDFVSVTPIANIISDTELHLSQPIRGLPAGVRFAPRSYAISADFTQMLMMPFPNRGETDNASLLRRAFETMDRAMPNAVE